MTVTAVSRPQSVVEVLQRISTAVPGVRHALVLGGGGRVVGSAGSPPRELVDLARSLSSALTAQEARVAGESARCVVTLSQHCVVVYVLGVDLAVALVGAPRFNVALATRLVEPLLVQFVDAYLPELAAMTAGRARTQVDPGAAVSLASARPRPENAPARAANLLRDRELRGRAGNSPAALERLPLRPRHTASLMDRVVAQRSPLKRTPLRLARAEPELVRDPVVLDRVLAGLVGL
jgi:predicted regulator of Ras-like GTPase activity (Roadblock/LC7/MglB family)